MNKKQKIVLVSFSLIAIISVIVWIMYGGEVFTKTQVMIENKDELFGWSEKQWINKFVWGLDLTLALIFISAAVSLLLFFLFRNQKNGKELS